MDYAKTFFKSTTLKKYAKKYLKVLPKNVTCLVSTGSSGVAIASAMMISSKRELKHWYIRKPNERAHESFVCPSLLTTDKFAIVDDSIASGNTIRRIIGKIKDHGMERNISCIISSSVSRGHSPFLVGKKLIKVFDAEK